MSLEDIFLHLTTEEDVAAHNDAANLIKTTSETADA